MLVAEWSSSGWVGANLEVFTFLSMNSLASTQTQTADWENNSAMQINSGPGPDPIKLLLNPNEAPWTRHALWADN